MTGLEIGLLVVGILSVVGSFFLTGGLSSSDSDPVTPQINEKEIDRLVERKVNTATVRIDEAFEEKSRVALSAFERQTDKVISEQIYSISDHGESMKGSMDESYESMKKTYDEVMFLYGMLNDKQEKVTQLVREIGLLESNLRNIKAGVDDQIRRLKQEQIVTGPLEFKEQESFLEDDDIPVPEPAISALQHKSPAADGGNINETILALHREGFTDVEIAKRLGKGLGEIELVLGLFEEG